MNHCAELSTSVSTFKASTQSEWAKDEGNYPCGKKGEKNHMLSKNTVLKYWKIHQIHKSIDPQEAKSSWQEG